MNQNKGRGWHGDSDGHRRAGRKGGQKTAAEYGQEFYHIIGSKGGRVSGGNFKNDPARASEAGRKGGRSKSSSTDLEEEDLIEF